jgi:hypothetical protein
MEPIAFAGQLTEADYRRVSALAGRKVVLAWTLAIAAVMTWLLWRWSWDAFVAQPIYTGVVFGGLALTIPISLALRPVMLRRHWRSNAILRQPFKGKVSDQGITWDIEGVTSNHVPWHLLLQYRASQSAVLVYVGLNQFFYFLPHHFSSSADWQRFRTLVATRLPRK